MCVYPSRNRNKPVIGYDFVELFGTQENGKSLVENHISKITSDPIKYVYAYKAINENGENEILISLDKKKELDGFEDISKYLFYLRRDGVLNLGIKFYRKEGMPLTLRVENSKSEENDFILTY